MRQKLVLILLLSCLGASSQVDSSNYLYTAAQERNESGYRHVITGSPFFITTGVAKFNYDYLGLHKHYSIGVGAFTSFVKTRRTSESDVKVRKFVSGIDINNKFYLRNIQEGASRIVNFYFNMGLSYSKMTFEYNTDIWTPFYNDGIRYYSLEDIAVKAQVNRYAAIPQLGIVMRLGHFHMEHYVGLRYASDEEKDNVGGEELNKRDFASISPATVEGNTVNSTFKRLIVGINLGYTF